jgi:hypothetical protein
LLAFIARGGYPERLPLWHAGGCSKRQRPRLRARAPKHKQTDQ